MTASTASGPGERGLAFEPGTVIAERYQVERTIGRGGMGVVLAARHLALETQVAIKVLSSAAAPDDRAVARFVREARAASRLTSEYVARVTDYGTLDDGHPFMVIEYLDGEDLHDLLDRGSMPVADAVDAALQACAALAEAHANGVVHRDVKPSNLFRTRRADGSTCIKVLDFGIARLEQRDGQPLTATGGVLGTPAYMSPEQIRSPREVDARTDVWSLGVTLYELLTARLPFDSDTVGALFALVLEQPPQPLPSTVPQALAAVIERCMAKNRAERYATMAELARALEPFGAGEGKLAAQRARGIQARATDPGEELPESADRAPHTPGRALAATEHDPSNQSAAIVARRLATLSVAAAATHQPATATPEAPRRWWLLAAAALVVGGAGVFAWRAGGSEEPSASAIEPQPAPSVAAIAEVMSAPAATSTSTTTSTSTSTSASASATRVVAKHIGVVAASASVRAPVIATATVAPARSAKPPTLD